ncbi:MAG: hypothetical protein EAX90_11165 [Candidatus Heimdallarchaeota archaeon]|nr:hypothetical protein [Candidatus Heimdallarchaeota archaeon]
MEGFDISRKVIAIFVYIFFLIIIIPYNIEHTETKEKIESSLQINNTRLDLEINWAFHAEGEIHSSPLLIDINDKKENRGKEIVVFTKNHQYFFVNSTGGKTAYGPACNAYLSSPVAAYLDNDDSYMDIFNCNLEGNLIQINSCGVHDKRFPSDSNVISSPVIADLERDRELEILFNTVDGKIFCINSTIEKKWIFYSNQMCSSSLVVADLNNDKKMEVLMATTNGTLICLNSLGKKIWEFESKNYNPFTPAIVDLDNDRKLEVIVNFQNGNITCVNHLGAKLWSWKLRDEIFIATPPSIADVDLDGIKDIFFGDVKGNIHVLNKYINSNYIKVSKIAELSDVEIQISIALSDLDGDGIIDIIVSSSSGRIYCIDKELAINDLNEGIIGEIAIPSPTSPIIVDINDDNKLEIIVGSMDGNLYCIKIVNISASGEQQWYAFRGNIFRTGQLDSDSDFIDDITESYFDIKPELYDSDFDLLSDGFEILQYSTNPNDMDTDRDKINDNIEVQDENRDPNSFEFSVFLFIVLPIIGLTTLIIILVILLFIRRNKKVRERFEFNIGFALKKIKSGNEKKAKEILENVIKESNETRLFKDHQRKIIEKAENILNNLSELISDSKKRRIFILISKTHDSIPEDKLIERLKFDSKSEEDKKKFDEFLLYNDDIANYKVRNNIYYFEYKSIAYSKFLFLAASPIDQDRMSYGKEYSKIREKLKSKYKNQFDPDIEPSVLYFDFTDYLDEHLPKIVHLTSHGELTGELYLEDEDGNSITFEIDELARIFSRRNHFIKCVVLNACHSEEQAKEIGRYIDIVIGMKRAIPDDIAILFSTTFYGSIAMGNNIQCSYEDALAVISAKERETKDIPSLMGLESENASNYFLVKKIEGDD